MSYASKRALKGHRVLYLPDPYWFYTWVMFKISILYTTNCPFEHVSMLSMWANKPSTLKRLQREKTDSSATGPHRLIIKPSHHGYTADTLVVRPLISLWAPSTPWRGLFMSLCGWELREREHVELSCCKRWWHHTSLISQQRKREMER